jgi:hypothetical protein
MDRVVARGLKTKPLAHFVRILVFSDSKKDWLAQSIIPRPLRELHLMLLGGRGRLMQSRMHGVVVNSHNLKR